MKNLKLLLILLPVLLLASCKKPNHVVLDNGNCTVYMVEAVDPNSYNRSEKRYKHYVTDKTSGFVLYSNTKFSIGDVISFEVKDQSP